MTLNQLIYFQKVATLENYHQAAEILYVSQPSLSRSMAALETELGITLFKRMEEAWYLPRQAIFFWSMRTRLLQTVM